MSRRTTCIPILDIGGGTASINNSLQRLTDAFPITAVPYSLDASTSRTVMLQIIGTRTLNSLSRVVTAVYVAETLKSLLLLATSLGFRMMSAVDDESLPMFKAEYSALILRTIDGALYCAYGKWDGTYLSL